MNIVAADWLPYCLPLRRPWQTSRGTLTERQRKLIRLQTDEGLIGWGDCVPLPEFGIDDTAATAYAEECARLDLAAQAVGVPLAEWLGGCPAPASVAVNANFGPTSTVDHARLASAAAAGFSVVKLKVGCAPLADEIAALGEIATALPPRLTLRLDANRAWDAADAVRFLAACRPLPIDGVEEPLRDPDLAFLAGLQASVPFPLAIDESTHLIACDFWRAPPVRRLVIKPARHGGLLASTELALRARASGMEVIVTSALESSCGIATLAHLAAAVAPDAVHGLATGEWLASDTGLPPRIIDGRMLLPKGNGIGFAVAGELCGRVAT